MPSWNEFRCRVDGRAPTSDPRPEHRWKHQVQRAVQDTWLAGRLHEPVGVEVRFECVASDMRRVALRNLLKPTLDGLAAVLFEREPSGNEWAHEDWRFFHLKALKSVALTPAVVIRLQSVGPPVLVSDSKATFVPGVPRPGETTGEKAWAAAIEGQIRLAAWLTIAPPLGISLRFVLPAGEVNKDIDNLVRVAAAAVERSVGLAGTLVEYIEASKEPQSALQPCGLFVRAWSC